VLDRFDALLEFAMKDTEIQVCRRHLGIPRQGLLQGLDGAGGAPQRLQRGTACEPGPGWRRVQRQGRVSSAQGFVGAILAQQHKGQVDVGGSQIRLQGYGGAIGVNRRICASESV